MIGTNIQTCVWSLLMIGSGFNLCPNSDPIHVYSASRLLFGFLRTIVITSDYRGTLLVTLSPSEGPWTSKHVHVLADYICSHFHLTLQPSSLTTSSFKNCSFLCSWNLTCNSALHSAWSRFPLWWLPVTCHVPSWCKQVDGSVKSKLL